MTTRLTHPVPGPCRFCRDRPVLLRGTGQPPLCPMCGHARTTVRLVRVSNFFEGRQGADKSKEG